MIGCYYPIHSREILMERMENQTLDDIVHESRFMTEIAVHVVNTKHSKEFGVAVRRPRFRSSHVIGQGVEDRKQWELYLYSFSDTIPMSNFEALLVQLAPNQCFLPSDLSRNDSLGDSKKIHALLCTHNVNISYSKKKAFVATNIDSNLKHLLGVSSLAPYEKELKVEIAIQSLSCLISELNLMTETASFGCYNMSVGALSMVMQLDGSAIWSLNLLPDPALGSLGKISNGSVLEILNRGKTIIGRRLLEQWIRQPLINLQAIEERQNIVQCFVENPSLRIELLQECMRNIPDLERLSAKLERQRNVKLEDLVSIYDAASDALPRILKALRTCCEDPSMPHKDLLHKVLLEPLLQIDRNMTGYVELIEEVVDFDSRPLLVINPKHDSELQKLRNDWDAILSEIEMEHQRARESIGGDVKCEKDKTRAFVFRIINKKEEARISKLPYVQICQVLVNGIHFTTTNLKALAAQYKQLQIEYEEQQSKLLQAAVEVACTYVPVIEAATSCLAKLDCLLGFAHAACHAGSGYCRPILSEHGKCVRIIHSRHPCVELQPDIHFISNSYELIKGQSHFQIITGPNMGGKSTYIRQLGILAVMAQIGSFVPADAVQLPIFDRLLVRVGAGDSQQRGVSTFMMEMLEASSILHNATDRSLVIIDELGRGTSTYDGFGLAWAISEHLITKVCAMGLFATHFHELTALANEYPNGTINRHVSAFTKDDSITMMYQVQDGPCMESFGVHVAEIAGFPASVIQLAKRKSQELELIEHQLSDTNSLTKTSKRQCLHRFIKDFAALPLDQIHFDRQKQMLLELTQRQARL